MKGDTIQYTEVTYKYKLEKDYSVDTGILGYNIVTDFIILDINGLLTIKKDYMWDGPSGPTWDSKNTLRTSLVHDALYQLMRLALLDLKWRKTADKLLKEFGIEDGMNCVRARLWEVCVNEFSEKYAKPGNEPKVLTAPR